MEPLRVAVLGTGRTGGRVLEAARAAPDLRVVATATRALAPGCFADAEVVVDFSAPSALEAALPHLGAAALVTGTTGLSEAIEAALRARAHEGVVVAAANFSTGVALLNDLVARAAAALPDYDLEIVEAHHRFKRDAPSGTARVLARAAATARGVVLDDVAVHGREGDTGPRVAGSIGVHAVRGGDTVGDHTVWLAGDGERVELRHVATSRDTFARGALRAARWTRGRPPGAYDLRDVLGLVR